MRALICRWTDDGIDGLRVEDVPPPPLPAGCVRIQVHAAAMNFADTLLVQGKYQEKPALPFAPGLEAAGVVLEVAPDVHDILPGQRVAALLDHGGFAEEAVARARDTVVIPDEVDFTTASAIPVAYVTSYLALTERARLQPKELLVVFGASGGVGLTAVEVGHAIGAHVIAVASSPERLEVAREHGADDVINYRTEDVRTRIEAIAGGADVVYDPVGGHLFEAAMHCIRPGGRILLIGFASGTVPQIPANHLLVKDASALGFSIGQLRKHRPDLVRPALADLMRLEATGQLHVVVSQRFRLGSAVEGLRLLESGRALGKLVIQIRDE